MKIATTFVLCSASFVSASADAAFVGWGGFLRTVGTNRVLDVFAVCNASTDRVLNVFNANIARETGGVAFVQQAGLSTRGWGRDAASSTRTNGTDSFMTIGTDGGGPYYGVYTASAASPDGNFTNWGGSGAPNTATAVAANAGWFFSPPTAPETQVEDISNSANMGFGTTVTRLGAAGNYGTWVAHIVVTNTNWTASGASLLWSASASVKDISGATNQTAGQTNFIPAPGAVTLLGAAGAASRIRRRK